MTPNTDIFAGVNFVRKFLQISGHWPHTTLSISSELRSFLSLASALIFLATNLMEIVFHFNDFQDLAENMAVTTLVFVYIVKLLVFKLKRRDFFCMMEIMAKAKTFEPQRGAHGDFVKRMGERCILAMKIYGGICSVVVTLHCCYALISETVLPVKFSYDFGSWVYGMYVFQMTAILNSALNTVCLDMLAVCFMGTAIAQLQSLEQEIHDLTKFDHGNYSPEEEKRRMKRCALHHIDIIKFLTSVEDIFNLFFLSQYLSSISSICNIGFQLANIDPMSAQFVTMVFFFSAMMWQLATFCWLGNEIILRSLAVGDACYETDWLQSSDEIKRSLIIVMTRANRQFAITAGKYSVLSLRSLTSIMNASYSYFALMQRLYKKEEI